MEVRLAVEEVEEPLVVEELGVPLLGLVVAEVIAQRHQEHIAPEEPGLLPVLVQEQACPLGHIGLRDSPGRHLPRAADPPTRQALEIELAADLWIRATRMGDIVAVERHHVAEDVCAGVRVPGLPPHELQAVAGGKVLLDGVVYPLNEHAGQVGTAQQVRHGGAVSKGVHRPA